jgi:multidrug efflux pump subunit AcrA (membrane-fusion protein)
VKARLPRSPLTYVLAGLCALVVAIAFVLVGPPSAPEAQQREVTVARGVVQSTVSGSGNLEPATELDLSFGTSGTVTAVDVEAGDDVVEGQVLARLDQRSARVALAQAKADYQAAEDALASAGSPTSVSSAGPATTTTASSSTAGSLGTVEGEKPKQGNSDTDSGSAQPQAESPSSQTTGGQPTGGGSDTTSGAGSGMSTAEAEANLESARLAVEEAEQALADTVLRAPANGTVAEVNGAVGDTTSGGSTQSASSSDSSSDTATGATGGLGGPSGGSSDTSTSSGSSTSGSGFVTLVDLDRLNLEVAFSESDIGKLEVGQAATVSVNALPDVKLAAKVTAIGVLSESSGSVVEYPVTVTLEQMDDRLKTGMTASADVVVEQADGAISVPSQAISPGPGGSTVTVDQDGEQQTRRVTTGLEGDSSTQIVSGLEPGDKVVIQTSSATGGAGGATPNLPGGGGSPGGGGGLPSGGPPGGGGFGGGGPPGGGGFGGGGPPGGFGR